MNLNPRVRHMTLKSIVIKMRLKRKLSFKDDDNKLLKNSLKSCTSENETLKSELKNLQKNINAKDKEIYIVETNNNNSSNPTKKAFIPTL